MQWHWELISLVKHKRNNLDLEFTINGIDSWREIRMIFVIDSIQSYPIRMVWNWKHHDDGRSVYGDKSVQGIDHFRKIEDWGKWADPFFIEREHYNIQDWLEEENNNFLSTNFLK